MYKIKTMNTAKHFNAFFEKTEFDSAISPTQISFYMALFRQWQVEHFKNPVLIDKKELMAAGKISSKATYHKCLKILHDGGYIRYKPTFHPYKSSKVFMLWLAK